MLDRIGYFGERWMSTSWLLLLVVVVGEAEVEATAEAGVEEVMAGVEGMVVTVTTTNLRMDSL